MPAHALAQQVQQNSVSIEELRELMAQLARSQMRTEAGLRQLQEEMRAFKEEMRVFKEEMRAFKDEMRLYQERADRERREMNRRWGELANKMGTLAEDLVAPSVPRVFRELLGCSPDEIQFAAVRVRKRHATEPGRMKEFDVVVVCNDYVLINETKSSLDAKDIDDFLATLQEIRDFFPEYKDKQFVGAIATLYMTPEVAKYAERKGLIALGFGEENMDILNSPDFHPKLF